MEKKEDHSSKTSHVNGKSIPAETSGNVHWDDSMMVNFSPNVFEINFSRDEIALLLGSERSGAVDQGKLMIQLSSQIIMNPFTAKRLADDLTIVIREHESRYGSLEMKAGSSQPSFKREKRTHKKEEHLFQLVKSLDVEMGFERSFKIFEKNLLGNRFLLGISKNSIEQKPHERILNICERMDMPESLLETFRENLSDANYVHFGFEENERSCVYKAYLEFYDKIEKEIKNRPNKSGPGPFLLHLGFKWDAFDNTKRALARYTWYPLLSAEDILVRLSNILDPHQYGKPLEIAKGIVGIASRRIPHYDILYLEVTEDNNPRRSFDINMYRAKLQLKELYPLLSKMWQHYSIPSDEFHKLYDRFKTKTFGHLSGGIDRAGRDFLTVYYGVEGSSR